MILCFALTASAQSDGGWKTKSWVGYEGQGKTDLDNGGDFDFWMLAMGLKSSKMMGDSMALTLGGDYRAVGYDFSDGAAAGRPWGTVHVVRFDPMLTYMMNEKWSLIGGANFQLSAEAGADVGDSLTAGGVMGVGYRWSKTGNVALGVVATSEIEDDAFIQPFVLVNFGITDNLSFNMEARNSRGGQAKLSYALGDKWTLGLGVGVRRERFRLDGSGPAALHKDGVGEEEAKVVNLSVAYQYSDALTIEAYGGSTADGEMRVENKTGSSHVKSDYDDAGYGGIRFKMGF
jgi:hypothetical protein